MHQRAVNTEFSIERVVPFFQPIIDLSTNKVWRYECLARLVTENEHIFLPSEFLYIVEREQANIELTHHIYALGHQYFSTHNMPWNINLSSADLTDAHLVDWLINECHQQETCLFGLEISFDDAIEHIGSIKKIMTECKRMSISIDDIEAVSPELITLLELGVDALKIRGALANSVSSNDTVCGEIKNLIKVCKDYSTKLVAEHIEDQETLNYLSNIGICFGQGYHFSRPASAI